MRINRWMVPLFVGATMLIVSACTQETATPDLPASEAMSGGSATIFDATSQAFAQPAPNLSAANLELHFAGDASFEAKFVSGVSPVRGGLGPVYNNFACAGCHVGDGRGTVPMASGQPGGMLLRLSVAGTDANGGPLPVPGFGTQLQDKAGFGYPAEGGINISYTDSAGSYGDGTAYALRVPRYQISSTYMSMSGGVLISPRVAPPVFGLGLLEAVSETSILSNSDEADANADGISGKANYVFDVQAGAARIGKFGWKANQPNLTQQTAGAYNGDMGITTTLFPLETCHGQVQDVPSHGPEADDETVKATTHYVRTLAVPARRRINDAIVRRGQQLFDEAKCAACHRPSFSTSVLDGVPEYSAQTIHPYTDLLLHDMGNGLADGRPDFLATGNEWRTPPLWGIGLTQLVNGHQNFLHDGRARTLAEAILWHGGEAAGARESFRTMSKADRDAVLAFLESL